LSKLRPVSHNELIRGLRAFGFEGPLSGSKHLYMLRGNLRLTIPNPHKQMELKRVSIRPLQAKCLGIHPRPRTKKPSYGWTSK
jgi:hypothetical protein